MKEIHTKNICIDKIVGMLTAVVSIEFKALGNVICFHISLQENSISNEIHVWELLRTL